MKRILVIDDDAETCEVIRLALDYEGFEVHCLSNAVAVFESINQFKPDILIIDYLLRGEFNGCEVCKQIKDNPLTEKLPVILITAYLLRFDPLKEYGVDIFIAKPFDLSLIINSVNALLR